MKEQYGMSQNSFNQNILRNCLKNEITTQEVKENLWKYCKKTLEKPEDNSKPDLMKKHAENISARVIKNIQSQITTFQHG